MHKNALLNPAHSPVKADIEEWQDYKFGMFIHWGLYSILGKGEWVMFNQPIDKDEYRKLADQFTAEAFNVSNWVQAAKSAGMKYMVLTTRHHDGFSLFDSKTSFEDFTSMNSAAHRDFVAEYATACREAGLGVGLYYSPLDWRMPGYFLPQLYTKSAEQLVEQCHNQVRELLTSYGKIDVLWYDGGEDFWLCHGMNLHKSNAKFSEEAQVANFWRADELDAMVRELQPGIVISNRTGMRQYGDFLTPEGKVGEFNIKQPWETCDTLAGTWGWMPGAQMKSLRECIQLLIRVVTGGGNLLLNVGPMADGTIEERQAARLQEIGKWLNLYGDSIYKTKGGPILNGTWGGTTWNENKLYVHVIDWKQNEIKIPKLGSNILNITSLTSTEVIVTETADMMYLTVPEADKQAIDTIFVVEYDKNVGEVYAEFDEKLFIQGKDIVSDALIV